jgi:very-short-patch-repair endonuclease
MKTTNKSLHSQYNTLARKLANGKRAQEYEMFRRKLAAFTGCEIEPEHVFFPGRKWRIDFAIVDLKIGIEIEGGVWSGGRHTRGNGFIDDMEKYNAAATLGWVILRFTPQDLNKITTFETVKKVVELKKD